MLYLNQKTLKYTDLTKSLRGWWSLGLVQGVMGISPTRNLKIWTPFLEEIRVYLFRLNKLISHFQSYKILSQFC
ncbi:unnamed protein product [Blepharisma stoltei]|uniref:Uncharacterized protein n=1 Tax=Blepharisma stoltei TaxID=1481888 RepID=A0AAU9JB12_9CILI|nr:unnamed protein product [Blepharisma stoltei]